MKIITFEDIQKLHISPALCYQWVEEMIRDKDQAILPPKTSLKPADGVFCNVMPCIIENASSYSRGGKNRNSISWATAQS